MQSNKPMKTETRNSITNLKRNYQVFKGIKKSRAKYTHKIQEHLADYPANAWNDIKKLTGLPPKNSNKPTDISFNPDDLNSFFVRFEKTDITSPTPPGPNPSAPTLNITEDAVVKQLKRLNSRKGAGPDGLLPKVIKMCADQLTPVITRLFKISLDSGTTPKIWKTATIKPLPKTTKPDQLKHFRPIALTSCLCKTMERLLKTYITENTPLDKYQFAYRARRSTQDAVLCLTTTVTNFIDQNSSYYARCLFLDFSSAFNTIDVRHLLPELKHLDSNVINWIASFLTGRTQRTVVNNIMSKPITTYTGTPQGSVLSPLLFSIYTNRLVSECSNVTIVKYADDTCIMG